jgi:hypothetical protein
MNKNLGLQLVAYSLVLAGLSYLTYYLAPTMARPSLYVGVGGGGLCLVWGAWAVAGCRTKALAILTLIPVIIVLLSQVVSGWLAGPEAGPGRRTAAVVVTLISAISLGMLMRITTAGMESEGQPANPLNKNGSPVAGGKRL